MAGANRTPALTDVEVGSVMTDSKRPQRWSFGEQYNNVLQLSKDRKNAYGGITESFKDFAEMGVHGREQWPLAAESIKRQFGIPAKKGDPDSAYMEHYEAASHYLLEWAVQKLRKTCPDLYRAYQDVFSPDLSGDRDWDYVQRKAAEAQRTITRLEQLPDFGEMTPKERAEARALLNKATAQSRWCTFAERVAAALNLLTLDLMHHELIVDFARLRTMREEKAMEDRNMNIYLLYRKVTDPPPDGYGLKALDAYEQIRQTFGISQSWAEQIVSAKREELTGEKRKPGRPPKKKGA